MALLLALVRSHGQTTVSEPHCATFALLWLVSMFMFSIGGVRMLLEGPAHKGPAKNDTYS